MRVETNQVLETPGPEFVSRQCSAVVVCRAYGAVPRSGSDKNEVKCT